MSSDVEGLDLEALEKIARDAPQWAWSHEDSEIWSDEPYRMLAETVPLDGDPRAREGFGVQELAIAAHIATFDPPTVLRLLAALRAQAERVRVLETAVLDAAISDRLDEAGSPLSWREVAEAAERRAGEAEARVIAEMEYANSSRNIAARLHGALAEIARGDVPPEKEGHYHAHREAVRIARAAFLPATQAEGEK